MDTRRLPCLAFAVGGLVLAATCSADVARRVRDGFFPPAVHLRAEVSSFVDVILHNTAIPSDAGLERISRLFESDLTRDERAALLVGRGVLLAAAQRPSKEPFRQAIALDPSDMIKAFAHAWLADRSTAEGDVEGAIGHLEALFECDADRFVETSFNRQLNWGWSARAALCLSQAYRQLGDDERAYEWALEARRHPIDAPCGSGIHAFRVSLEREMESASRRTGRSYAPLQVEWRREYYLRHGRSWLEALSGFLGGLFLASWALLALTRRPRWAWAALVGAARLLPPARPVRIAMTGFGAVIGIVASMSLPLTDPADGHFAVLGLLIGGGCVLAAWLWSAGLRIARPPRKITFHGGRAGYRVTPRGYLP